MDKQDYTTRCRPISNYCSLLVFVASAVFMMFWGAGGPCARIASPRVIAANETKSLFARDNLVAWCIVPFDAKNRGPEQRALMLKRLGFQRFAYDWRAEHIPSFDAEMEALKKQKIRLQAFWFPGELNQDAKTILELLKRHQLRTELWVTIGDPAPQAKSQAERVAVAAARLKPIAEMAAQIGCSVGLYNHGGWFGEPENQLAIIAEMKLPNIGLVYNLHHGHAHLARFPELLAKMRPHLYAINLNGMVRDGETTNRKILPIGAGDLDLELLKAIHNSGYEGPIGILGHTSDDAEARLRDNLDGLDWLAAQLDGKAAAPQPKYRTYQPAPAPPRLPLAFSPELIAQVVADARAHGDARRGALVFQAAQFACFSCHKVGNQGGTVGPDLSTIGQCQPPEKIVESVLWPKREVKDGYSAIAVFTADGKTYQGYKEREDNQEIVLRDPATGVKTAIAKGSIDGRREIGSLMPEGLAEAMSPEQRRDVVRFLMELGRPGGASGEALLAHGHRPATFPYDRAPLRPDQWPHWQEAVNRDRIYDFYAKEAEYFLHQPEVPLLLQEFPGLDGGKYGHWGNQNEQTWADDRWNRTDLGSVQCGVFHGPGLTVPRAVCVRLGDHGEMAACFNPDTLCYESLWQGGFLQFSAVRHGFLDGLRPDGKPLPRPVGEKPDRPFVYHGFYRHGRRVLFSYRLGEVEMLDAPWAEDGKFVRLLAPAASHPLARLIRGGPAQWPQVLETHGTLGAGKPYALDNIPPPFANPWHALFFFGDHDFLPNGAAMLCTMQGDVWRVEGIDDKLDHVRWRRFASGLHHALGLVVADDKIYVLGRDQITRLHDLNGDGEADFYECFSSAYIASPAGHDFICGLERDAEGRFYTASGRQGLLRISADGRQAEVLATGFRNPDGLGLLPDGAVTVPCSEGEWTPASMICEVRPSQPMQEHQIGGHTPPYFGYGGPKNGRPPDLPLVYLPRGLDNSSGGQAVVSSRRWGPLDGQLLHFSYGAGTHFLVLRDEVRGQPQGAVVPLPGEFLSGVHRGRFNPKDGQLYASGMGGWGTYTVADGCFQRVRYAGEPVQLPSAFHAYLNGLLITFTSAVDANLAGKRENYFAQAWNYRYNAGYGSAEYSARHPGVRGHDAVAITAAHVLADGRSVFLEMPDLQPVNQVHLHMRPYEGIALDLFATVHELDNPFTVFPGYHPAAKTIAAHPILTDLALIAKSAPSPWRKSLPNARPITIEAGKNLTYSPRLLQLRAGEPIKLTFTNPDVVPHNWVLLQSGTLERIGDLANKLVSDPEAAARHYIPTSTDVLAYTDIVQPEEKCTIFFRTPPEKGRYPFLCTFPGHWMVMNGEMVVE